MKILKIKFIVKARAVLTLLFYLLVVYIVLGTLFVNYFTTGVLCLGIVLAYLLKSGIIPYVRRHLQRRISCFFKILFLSIGCVSFLFLLLKIIHKANRPALAPIPPRPSPNSRKLYHSYKLTVKLKNNKESNIYDLFDIKEKLEFIPRIKHNTETLNQENNGCIALKKIIPTGARYYEYKSLECTNAEELKQHINIGLKE
ncbi:MAG: CrcB family protein [Moorea sp. SIO2B7]|nr:CrcB family protein [Moorena sp. SIO2B7]